MSSKKYDNFKDLKKGKYDWKVHARVMNMWRGITKSGEPFKSFNMLLVDSKRGRIHAFVPGNVAPKMENCLEVGNIYLIENFTVKDYRKEDNFLCVRKQIQIIFSDETKIKQVEETAVSIEDYVFDFFDLEELQPVSNQIKFLTDVIGVMENSQPISKFKNRHGQVQSQIKFKITDGSTSVKVTFWDEFAQLFYDTLQTDLEYPVIIIIGSGRVTRWNEEIDISNVGATTFYLNIQHHSVTEMRKRLLQPDFCKGKLSRANKSAKVYSVKEIQNMVDIDTETAVLCQVQIKLIADIQSWCVSVCTSCYKNASMVGPIYKCIDCGRNLSYPDKKFQICLTAFDETGELSIVLKDREVRTLIGKNAFSLIHEGATEERIPCILKSIEGKKCTIKLVLSKDKISSQAVLYLARDIKEGFDLEGLDVDGPKTHPHPIETIDPAPSGSSYHLDALSEISNRGS